MAKARLRLWLAGSIPIVAAGLWLFSPYLARDRPDGSWLETFTPQAGGASIAISEPAEGTLYPPDFCPPRFAWADSNLVEAWQVVVEMPAGSAPLTFLSRTPEWQPEPRVWKRIQHASREADLKLHVLGWRGSRPREVVSHGAISIRTSPDPVDAPVFFREVPLPFMEAVKDPSRIRWRLGRVSSPAPPPVVLEGLPVCGNCHSFPRQADHLAMDVDYASSKASYVIAPIKKNTILAPRDIITWDDFRREDGQRTYGLLSQISPDGQTVISTVKDRSVFVARPDLEFSQLFFPIKGILAVYDRASRTFRSLPGADDPEYVQSNPVWSPDGKHIVFARAKAYQLRRESQSGKALLSPDECKEFLEEGKPFRFDLYRIPFNEGRGGTPQPLEGASHNGRSNFFPRYSPDGRWIVYCQSSNYMLLQPDSALYIIPAQGGAPRRMECNTARMNSWHSWSPNSRWLVFSSKANGAYTQLFLTHIDDQGRCSPALCLPNLTASNRAANIPEFVNLAAGAMDRVTAQFLDDASHARAGFACELAGDFDRAVQEYRKALELNPANPHAHEHLGAIYGQRRNDPRRGIAHSRQAVHYAPDNGQAHFILGRLLLHHTSELSQAITHLEEAQRLFPVTPKTDAEYTLAGLHRFLGLAWMIEGDLDRSQSIFETGLALEPDNADLHFGIASCLVQKGEIDRPLNHYQRAVARSPGYAQSAHWHEALAVNYARAGRYPEALASVQQAIEAARTNGDETLLLQLRSRLEQLKEESLLNR